MTTEERFERIEHVTAGLAEERRKDREEFRRLWRDTQGQINEVATRLNELTIKVADVDDRLGKRIEALAEESRAADRRLGERIESMVSAIGEFIRVQREKG
jgi:methyl-accepting chemotaxis protein